MAASQASSPLGGAHPTPGGPDAWDAHAARMRQRFGGSAAKPGALLGGGGGLVQHPMVAPSPSLATRRGNAPGLFSSKLHSAAPSAAASPRDTTAGMAQRAQHGGPRGGMAVGGALEEDDQNNALAAAASAPPDRSTHALAASEAASSARTGALASVRREAAKLAAEVGVESARRREADASLAAERASHVAEVTRLSSRVAELVRVMQVLRDWARVLRCAGRLFFLSAGLALFCASLNTLADSSAGCAWRTGTRGPQSASGADQPGASGTHSCAAQHYCPSYKSPHHASGSTTACVRCRSYSSSTSRRGCHDGKCYSPSWGNNASVVGATCCRHHPGPCRLPGLQRHHQHAAGCHAGRLRLSQWGQL
jgi:hypothetical protein